MILVDGLLFDPGRVRGGLGSEHDQRNSCCILFCTHLIDVSSHVFVSWLGADGLVWMIMFSILLIGYELKQGEG